MIKINQSEVLPEPNEDDTSTSDQSSTEDNLGEIETCTIHRLIDNAEARIDTGAKYCSLHVDNSSVEGDWVKFTRGDVTYKVPVFKTVKIRQASLDQSISRPVVKLDITIRGIRLNQVEFTLNDRSTMKYEILIGRNVLSELGIPVIFQNDSNDLNYEENNDFSSEEE